MTMKRPLNNLKKVNYMNRFFDSKSIIEPQVELVVGNIKKKELKNN